MKRKKLTLAIAGLCAMLLCGSAGLVCHQTARTKDWIRLRVVANSDSFIDQSMKLRVRDAVAAYCAEMIPADADGEIVQRILTEHLPELRDCVNQEVKGRMPAIISIARDYAPTRSYRSFSAPAGRYRNLRIVLGAGQGKNWWCVIYPTLCLQTDLQHQEEPDTQDSIAFKSVEWINMICHEIWS